MKQTARLETCRRCSRTPDDPRIRMAFGPNANHAEISKVVDTLANRKLKVQ